MKKLPVIILAVLSVIVLASCNLNNDTSNPQQGYFLLSNISPDAPPLNISINGNPFVSNLGYGIYSQYYNTDAGSYAFGIYNSSTQLLSSNLTIEPSKAYSYILVDSFSKLKATFIEDKLIQPSGDSVYVRFFNFCPNSNPLSLVDSTSGTIFANSRTFNDQASNSSLADFTRYPAGVYTLQLKDPLGTVIVSRKDTLSGGHDFTLIARGLIGGGSGKEVGIGQIQNF